MLTKHVYIKIPVSLIRYLLCSDQKPLEDNFAELGFVNTWVSVLKEQIFQILKLIIS